MNEEQSDKLIQILENINTNILKLSQEKQKESSYNKELIKLRIQNFIKYNKDLKFYDLQYLEQILREEKFGNGYLFFKEKFEKRQKND